MCQHASCRAQPDEIGRFTSCRSFYWPTCCRCLRHLKNPKSQEFFELLFPSHYFEPPTAPHTSWPELEPVSVCVLTCYQAQGSCRPLCLPSTAKTLSVVEGVKSPRRCTIIKVQGGIFQKGEKADFGLLPSLQREGFQACVCP